MTSTEALSQWAWKHLAIKRDRHGVYKASGGASWSNGELTPDKLKMHFSGMLTLGVGSTNTDDLCNWVAWDIDNHDGGHEMQNLAYAEHLCQKLRQVGLSPVLEDSDGKGGFHVWVIFSEPVEALRAFQFVREMAAGHAEHGLQEVECLPKGPTVQHTEKKCGTYLRVPGKHHKRDHWSRLKFRGTWEPLETLPDVPLNDPEKLPEVKPAEPEPEPLRLYEPATDEEILSALAAIPNGGLHYDEWLEVGMALHAHSPRMLPDFQAWSATSEKHNAATTEKKWRSFNGNGKRTPATIFHKAHENGWVRPTVFEPESDDVTLTHLLESLLGVSDEYVPDTIPPSFLEVPGLIGDVIRFNLKTAIYPLPELAMAAALSLMSTITGHKVSFRKARSNLYTIGTAPTSGGKEHARRLNRDILRESGFAHTVGPERIGSHAGLLSHLKDEPISLFQLDEIGDLVAAMQNKQATHLMRINDVLKGVYTSSDSTWTADALADRTKVKTLQYPHCVVYGTGVPDSFWDNLGKNNIADGLLGRFLIFDSPDYVKSVLNEDTQEHQEIPQGILEAVQRWGRWQTHTGNLKDVEGCQGAHAVPMTATAEANARLNRHIQDISDRRVGEDHFRAAIWSRSEKTIKLAMLFACSRFDGDTVPQVTIEDADRAVMLNNWLTRRLLKKAEGHVADSEFERKLLRVKRVIARSGGMTRAKLGQIVRMPSREMTDILSQLQMTGELVATEQKTGGRPITILTCR